MNKIRLTALIATLTAAAIEVHGAILDDVKIDTQNSIVTVSGQLPVKKAGQMVGVEIFGEGVTREVIEAASDSELAGMLVNIGQIKTDEEGKYTFSFKQNTESGDFVARIGYGKANKSREKSYGYFNINDIQGVLSSVNDYTEDDIEDFIKLLDNVGSYIGVDTEAYGKISDKENTLCALLAERGSGFSDIGTFIGVLDRCMVMQLVNEAEEVAVLGIINKYQAVFENYSAFNAWKNLDSDGQDAVVKAIKKDAYTNATGFYDAFCFNSIAQAIYRVTSYGDVEDIIKDNHKFLKLDMEDYNDLGSNKQKVWKALSENLYSSAGDMKDAFNDAVKAAKPKKTSSPSGGGGGGGGSYSSSSGVAAVIPSTTQPTDTKEDTKTKVFSDLEAAKWAEESIMYLYNAGIVSGDTDGTFRPGDNVTRAEFVMMTVKALSLMNEGATVSFEDVGENDWFYKAVASAVEAGVVSGVDESRFAPYENLTREQMAAIVCRAAGYVNIALKDGEAADFTDKDNISEYAKEAVEAMQKAGIINGMGDGSFNPKGLTTRAAASVVLHKLITGGDSGEN